MNRAQRAMVDATFERWAHNGTMSCNEFLHAVRTLLEENLAEVKDEPEPQPSSALDAQRPTHGNRP